MQVLNTVFLLSGGWIQAIQLFAALSVLIVLHEFGHFFFARLFKTRVEKFYLFFDFMFPFPNVLPFSLFKKKKGDTEYGIGWFPLGGYVKIAGMVDESMDKEAMKLPPQPWEYRSKKPWQKLFIMLGGIIMNILVAIVIYIAIYGIWGENYLPAQNAKYGIVADSLAQSVGFKNGDKIISVGGKKVDRYEHIMKRFILEDANSIVVEREGQPVTITIPDGTINNILSKREKKSFIQLRSPFLVGDVKKGSVAAKMGLKKGDSISAINNTPIHFFDEFEDAKKTLKEQPISLSVVRNNQIITLNETLPKDGILGCIMEMDRERYFQMDHIRYGFFSSITRGFQATYETFAFYIEQFKFLFTSKEVKASESLGGFVSFGQMFPTVFTWEEFLNLVAFVSVILAFMNLLPIPGLDGGYVFFLLFEMVSGRQVSDKVMERATTVGLVLLLGLMLWANGMDVFRLFQ